MHIVSQKYVQFLSFKHFKFLPGVEILWRWESLMLSKNVAFFQGSSGSLIVNSIRANLCYYCVEFFFSWLMVQRARIWSEMLYMLIKHDKYQSNDKIINKPALLYNRISTKCELFTSVVHFLHKCLMQNYSMT